MSDSEPTVAEGKRIARGRAPTPDRATDARFEEVREIARGGMGRVVEAYDRELGRTVALKQSLDDHPEIRARFEREVAITARLEHPSIVPVYDAGVSPSGEPYYVMRKVTGTTLEALVARAKSLDERLLLLVNMLAVADAIAHAHQREIIHRDLKLSNVLVGELGETIVIDWGLAKLLGETDTAANAGTHAGPRGKLETTVGAVIGTPGFMAPEQVRGELTDARSDVYALGASMFHVLAGHPPFSGDEAEVFERTLRGVIPELPEGVPADLVTIVHTAMSLDPAKRYLDAGGFGEELRRFLDGQLVASHRYRVHQRALRWIRKHRALVVGIAIAAGVAIAVAVVSLQRVLAAQARTETALAAERDRTDELVVANASAYLETDPTRAVAMLQDLRAGSPRWGALVPFIEEARARGVAWSAPFAGKLKTITFAHDRSGRFVTSGTVVAIHDLANRTVTPVLDAGRGIASADWFGDKIVIVGNTVALQMFDPATGRLALLSWPDKLRSFVSSTTAVAFLDTKGAVVAAEVGQPLRAIDGLEAGEELVLSRDGRWLVIIADDHAQIVRHDGATWTPVGRLAAILTSGRFDLEGRLVYTTSDELVTVDLVTQAEISRQPIDPRSFMWFADRRVTLASSRAIRVAGATIVPPLDTTAAYADPALRWLVGVADGRLLAWELTHVLPEVTKLPYDATHVALLRDAPVMEHVTDRGRELSSLDGASIAAGKVIEELEIVGDVVIAVDRLHGTNRFVRPLLASSTAATYVGDALATGAASGVIALDGLEVGNLHGPVESLASNGGWLVARAGGTLWRRAPDGAVTQLTDHRAPSRIAIGPDGTWWVAIDHVLARATSRLDDVATFTAPIRELVALESGRVAIVLADGGLYLLAAGSTQPRLVFQSATDYAFSRGARVAATAAAGGIAVIDLTTGDHVQLLTDLRVSALALTHDGATLYALAGDRLARFALVVAPPTLDSVRAMTNARPPIVPRGPLEWR